MRSTAMRSTGREAEGGGADTGGKQQGSGQYIDPVSIPALPLPGLCAVCRRWARGRLCPDCVRSFAPAVPRCGQCAIRLAAAAPRCGACLQRPQAPVQRTVAAVDYGFPWDGLITGLKFHERLELASPLARLLHAALGSTEEANAVDLIVPIPLSRERLRERGFNQAWEIARRIGRWRRTPARAEVLLRVKNTAHQLGLSESERAANLRQAFLVEPRETSRVQGRTVALVDDVSTSGATADEAARALRLAGAKAVHLWVVARTP